MPLNTATMRFSQCKRGSFRCRFSKRETCGRVPLPIRCQAPSGTQNFRCRRGRPKHIQGIDLNRFLMVTRTIFGCKNAFFRCRQGNGRQASVAVRPASNPHATVPTVATTWAPPCGRDRKPGFRPSASSTEKTKAYKGISRMTTAAIRRFAVPSPEELIERARSMVPEIRALAEETERNRNVLLCIIDKIRDAGLLRTCRPKEFGGFEYEARWHSGSRSRSRRRALPPAGRSMVPSPTADRSLTSRSKPNARSGTATRIPSPASRPPAPPFRSTAGIS